jgi:DNA-binding response OmpR family regulator
MTGKGPAILIVADDLIWADRLATAATAASARPVRVRTLAGLTDAASGDVDLAIVDLTARAYDGVEAVRIARDRGLRVLAVGQHDDHDLRRHALDAGAERVLAYQKLATDGPATISRFVARATTASR